MSPAFGLVIPDLIRDPVPHHHWIAGQARNDKTLCKIWLMGHSAQELLGSDTNFAPAHSAAA